MTCTLKHGDWIERLKEMPAESVHMVCTSPFNGAGTSGLVATRLGRDYIGIDLKGEYIDMSNRRIVDDAPLFNSAIEEVTEESAR